MNDPLVNIWIITEQDGAVMSAHSLGCKAWILPTYVNEVPYARVKDINFSSAKKLKENLDQKIDNLDIIQQPAISSQQDASHSRHISTSGAVSDSANLRPSKEAIDELYVKLNQCEIKAVALSSIPPFADQFVDQSRSVPVVSKFFHTENVSLAYTELLRKCNEVQLNYSDEQIKLVEETSQTL